MFVKICGITNREDALAAVDAGARALGFVFYSKSPRRATPEDVATWINEVPADVWKVGVFVNEDPELIEQIAAQVKLDIAQLHGNETPERHPRGLRIWKAFRIGPDASPNLDYPAEAIILDGPGSGQTFAWNSRFRISRGFVLAGGLTPENVRQAIGAMHPWGVDVASGVEASPGRKDHARMKLFIKAALSS